MTSNLFRKKVISFQIPSLLLVNTAHLLSAGFIATLLYLFHITV